MKVKVCYTIHNTNESCRVVNVESMDRTEIKLILYNDLVTVVHPTIKLSDIRLISVEQL